MPIVQVRPDVIAALGKLARGGASLEARANAARALGILRGRAAIPDLVEALHSKDDQVMYERWSRSRKSAIRGGARALRSCCAIWMKRFRLRRSKPPGSAQSGSRAGVRDALDHARTIKVRRAALRRWP